MPDRYVEIHGTKYRAEQAREVITRETQKIINDPNKSEAFKDVTVDVAVELLNQIEPPEEK